MDEQGLHRINLYSLVFVSILGFSAFFSYTLLTKPFYYVLINPFTFIPLLFTIILVAVVHELIHYTSGKLLHVNPKLAMNQFRPSVEVSETISKTSFYIISLSPVILISSALVFGLYTSPHRFISYLLLFALVFNLVGSRSDIATAIYVQRYIGGENVYPEDLR